MTNHLFFLRFCRYCTWTYCKCIHLLNETMVDWFMLWIGSHCRHGEIGPCFWFDCCPYAGKRVTDQAVDWETDWSTISVWVRCKISHTLLFSFFLRLLHTSLVLSLLLMVKKREIKRVDIERMHWYVTYNRRCLVESRIPSLPQYRPRASTIQQALSCLQFNDV